VTVGAVLAGGRSRRMGTAKAMVEVAGRPMVARVVSTVGSAGLEPVVVTKPDSPLPRLDCRVLTEPPEPRHPLTGLLAALHTSAGRGVVAIACDMPLVPANLLAWLAQLEAEAAVCEVDGRLQPLLGRYAPSIADRLAAGLGDGVSMREAVTALDPYIVGEDKIARFGDPRGIVFNVNEPDDVERAERLLRQMNRGIRPLAMLPRRPG
jgi:molybdenum cofactor guanylyltransferase